MTSRPCVEALDILNFVKSAPLEDVELVLELSAMLMDQRRSSQPDERQELASPEETVEGGQPETTIRDRVIRVLKDRGEVMDPASLTAAINDRYGSKHTKGSVNGELVRSIKDRVLIRPKFGQYGLPEWEDAIQEIEQMERDVLQEMEDDVGPTPF